MGSSMMYQDGDLVLDRSIFIWVLLPISFVTFAMCIFRHYALVSAFKPPRIFMYRVRLSSHLTFYVNFRKNSGLLPHSQFEMRRYFFIHPQSGFFSKSAETKSISSTIMSPDFISGKAIDMMYNMLPQMALGAWARYFFGGFAVIKLPFPLSDAFRGMLQSGIELTGRDLDVSYVSSLSWYVLNLFGNQVLFKLIVTESESGNPKQNKNEPWQEDTAKILNTEMNDQIELNFDKSREVEKERLKLLKYENLLVHSEMEILKVDPKSFGIQ